MRKLFIKLLKGGSALKVVESTSPAQQSRVGEISQSSIRVLPPPSNN